jgi:hypothetical protein
MATSVSVSSFYDGPEGDAKDSHGKVKLGTFGVIAI